MVGRGFILLKVVLLYVSAAPRGCSWFADFRLGDRDVFLLGRLPMQDRLETESLALAFVIGLPAGDDDVGGREMGDCPGLTPCLP
jgi:hypothetical protein